jgi:hypothetical protein
MINFSDVLRQTIAECWAKLGGRDGGSLFGKTFITFNKECGLDDAAMHHIIEQHNHFLAIAKQRIVTNLNDINEVIELELEEDVDVNMEGEVK